jgi:hypothetical protein
MKKILRIEVINPELGEVVEGGEDYRGLVFGYNKNSNRETIIVMFCQGVLEYAEHGGERGSFLTSLIVSASESLQANYPDLAADVRKKNIEYLKNQNNKP